MITFLKLVARIDNVLNCGFFTFIFINRKRGVYDNNK